MPVVLLPSHWCPKSCLVKHEVWPQGHPLAMVATRVSRAVRLILAVDES